MGLGFGRQQPFDARDGLCLRYLLGCELRGFLRLLSCNLGGLLGCQLRLERQCYPAAALVIGLVQGVDAMPV